MEKTFAKLWCRSWRMKAVYSFGSLETNYP